MSAAPPAIMVPDGHGDCTGGGARRRACPAPPQRRGRRRACSFAAAAAVLLASVQVACSQSGPGAFPGQSFNLTATSYGVRAVSLGWFQQDNISYANGQFHLAKYIIYNGDQVILDDPNVTSVAATIPCGANTTCAALQLVAQVGDLALGYYYDFTVAAVYSHVQGGSPVAGARSGSLRMLVTDAPTAPRDLSAAAIPGGVRLSWKPPANTGLGSIWSIFYSNSSEVLRGYQVLVSTSSTYNAAGCPGGQSQSCQSEVLPSWAEEASVSGLQAGATYHVWLLAYNVLFAGDVAALAPSFSVRTLPSAPRFPGVSLEDHLVVRLQWQPPLSAGATAGRAIDHYMVEWTRGSADFKTCRAGGGLQCYSTKHIALQGVAGIAQCRRAKAGRCALAPRWNLQRESGTWC